MSEGRVGFLLLGCCKMLVGGLSAAGGSCVSSRPFLQSQAAARRRFALQVPVTILTGFLGAGKTVATLGPEAFAQNPKKWRIVCPGIFRARPG